MNTAVKNIKSMAVVFISGFLLIVFLYVLSCYFIASKREKAFDAINIGDTESVAVDLFGEPSVREKQGVLFNRYATTPCQAPCVERLWFENRLSFDIEAWSIEIDESRHVINKYHWVSP